MGGLQVGWSRGEGSGGGFVVLSGMWICKELCIGVEMWRFVGIEW